MIKTVSEVKNNWLYLGLKAEDTQGIWSRMQTFGTANNMLWNFEQTNNSNLYHIFVCGKDFKSKYI